VVEGESREAQSDRGERRGLGHRDDFVATAGKAAHFEATANETCAIVAVKADVGEIVSI